MLKQWIRRRKLSSLSVDLNHLRIRYPVARGESGGLMASAEEFYLAWRDHFETLVRLARGGDGLDARSERNLHLLGM